MLDHLTPLENLLYGTDEDLTKWYNSEDLQGTCGLSEIEHHRAMRGMITEQIREKMIYTIEFLIEIET